jgi:hypothetical protein
MRGLSVRQPWAELIAAGKKTIEIRTWVPTYRGPILICGGKEWHPRGVELHGRVGQRGVAICTVDLVEVRPLTDKDAHAAGCKKSDMPDEAWAWVLAKPKRVKALPVSGQLGLFSVDSGIVVAP